MSGSAYRESFRLAWPLVLSNISVPLLGMVDTAVVGRLPEPYALGGVALGANLASTLYFTFGFLRMGTTALTAQAFGAGNALELRACLWRAFLLAAAIGLAIALVMPLLVDAGRLIFAPPELIDPEFTAYARVRLLGAPLALANAVVLGWLLGMQDARAPLALLIATNLLNGLLDVAFVWGLGFGAGGVAAATVIAEAFGLALGIFLIHLHLARLHAAPRPSRSAVLAPAAFRRLFRLNGDLFVRTVVLQLVFILFMALGSRQGPVILAINAILLNFFLLASYGLDGFAYAAEAMVARAVGARDPAALRAAVRAGLANAATLAIATGLAFWLASPWIVKILTDIPAVRDGAIGYRPFVALLPLVAVWAFLLDGIFIGATRTRLLRNAMILAVLIFAGAALALVPVFGNPGLWTAMLVFMAARGGLLALIYRRAGSGADFASGEAAG
ncbi:MAG TPA: MATE family efflux transporter [Geminicoccaceae bacterium]|nr:MATE family efflux transporter [Geminicoccaceae bacterium]